MKSTNNDGTLRQIDECYLIIPNFGRIIFDNLPDISDSKSASYNEESIIGRSSPLHTYAYSGTRQISINFHFFITTANGVGPGTPDYNLSALRAIASCAYPREGDGEAPYVPPVICKFKCGDILAKDSICLILQNYSVNFPTEVAWDERTFCPYRFDVQTSWWVVYASADLPYQGKIMETGY